MPHQQKIEGLQYISTTAGDDGVCDWSLSPAIYYGLGREGSSPR